jgi:hemin uptake protein HemP
MSAAVERADQPRRSQPTPDLQDAVYSAELFDPGGELHIRHRGRLYRLRVARAGHLELVGPKASSRTPRAL